MVITAESKWNSLKVIFTDQFLTKVVIFCCFGVGSVRPPHIFQIQAKISTVRVVFPDYLSVSYDYGENNQYIEFLVELNVIQGWKLEETS